MSPKTFARILCTGRLPVVHMGRKARIEDTALLAWFAKQGRLPAGDLIRINHGIRGIPCVLVWAS